MSQVSISNRSMDGFADDSVTNAKLANITRGSVKVGGVADAPKDLDAKTDSQILIGDATDITSVAMSGDIAITNTGATTIANDAVTDVKIIDDAVTNDKLANIVQGSVKVGGVANAPTDLDAKTDAQILIGNGTGVSSVAVSGDIAITNTGVTSIGAKKVVTGYVNDAAITQAQMKIKTVVALADAAATLTAAQMIDSGIFTITPGAGRVLTTDTATNIVAALSDYQVGTWFDITIVCLAAHAATLTAGVGITIVGNAVANNASGTWKCRIDSATAITIYRM